MENFMTIDWAQFELFEFIQFGLFLAFIIFGNKVNKNLAVQVYSNLIALNLGHKSAIFSILRFNILGYCGSSVMTFAAFGLSGLTVKMDFTFVFMAVGLWLFYLINNYKKDLDNENNKRQSNFF